MPRNKLQAALKNNGGAIANVTPRYEKLTDEQMREIFGDLWAQ